jgi:hypothetical protein
MIRPLISIAVVVALAGTLFWGVREHRRAEALAAALLQTEAQAAKAQTATQACADRSRSSLGQAFASAMATHRQPAKAAAAPAHEDEEHKRFDELSGDQQSEIFDEAEKQKKSAQQRLDQLASKLQLNAEQTQALHQDVDKMNERIGRALVALVPIVTQGENLQTRPAIDAVADGLNAIRETEDAFRRRLNEQQQGELAANPLDFVKQVDTSLLLTSALAFAANAPPANSNGNGVSVSVSGK